MIIILLYKVRFTEIKTQGELNMANLTAEELKALEDQLNMEQLLIKKYRSYASMTADPQIKQTCENIANMHKQHFDKLMGHLCC